MPPSSAPRQRLPRSTESSRASQRHARRRRQGPVMSAGRRPAALRPPASQTRLWRGLLQMKLASSIRGTAFSLTALTLYLWVSRCCESADRFFRPGCRQLSCFLWPSARAQFGSILLVRFSSPTTRRAFTGKACSLKATVTCKPTLAIHLNLNVQSRCQADSEFLLGVGVTG